MNSQNRIKLTQQEVEVMQICFNNLNINSGQMKLSEEEANKLSTRIERVLSMAQISHASEDTIKALSSVMRKIRATL